MSDRTLPGIRPRGDKKPKYWPWWLALLGGAVLLSVIIGVSSGAHDDGYDSNNEYEAIAQCEAAIENRLKAPSTASFDSSATGSGTWIVSGTVDAENSFGAMVRNAFECSVIIDGEHARTKINYFE